MSELSTVQAAGRDMRAIEIRGLRRFRPAPAEKGESGMERRFVAGLIWSGVIVALVLVWLVVGTVIADIWR